MGAKFYKYDVKGGGRGATLMGRPLWGSGGLAPPCLRHCTHLPKVFIPINNLCHKWHMRKYVLYFMCVFSNNSEI